MRALLLAAGYATRLEPFTTDCPKPLLPVAGVPMLDYILSKVFQAGDLASVTLVTNHKFFEHFANWLQWRKPPVPIDLIDDGSTSNETRLGAIGDIALAIERQGLDDDLLVLATDNLFSFDLAEFAAFARRRAADAVILRHEPDLAARRRTGIAEIDADHRLIGFAEKPEQPKTSWAVPPFYYYRRETVPELRRYLDEGNNPDAPGNFVAWLHQRRPIYGFRVTSEVVDIGTPDIYREANRRLTRERLAGFGVRPW